MRLDNDRSSVKTKLIIKRPPRNYNLKTPVRTTSITRTTLHEHMSTPPALDHPSTAFVPKQPNEEANCPYIAQNSSCRNRNSLFCLTPPPLSPPPPSFPISHPPSPPSSPTVVTPTTLLLLLLLLHHKPQPRTAPAAIMRYTITSRFCPMR